MGFELGKLFSYSIPDYEIHMQNEPVAMMYLPGRRIQFYKIKPKGRYFILKSNKVKGIFEMKDEFRSYIGKTVVYQYNLRNHTNFDPVLVDEVNKFMRTNKLSKLKRKDVRHASKLRLLINKFGSQSKVKQQNEKEIENATNYMDDIQNEENKHGEQLNTEIQNARVELTQQVDTYNKTNEASIAASQEQTNYFIVEHLHKKGFLDSKDYASFVYKLENKLIKSDELIDELKEMHAVHVVQPIDTNVESFLEEFGAQNPSELIGFIDDMRKVPKGLKGMTNAPIKSFIPGSMILSIGLVIIIAFVVIGQNPDMISNLIGSGAGGLKLPFLP